MGHALQETCQSCDGDLRPTGEERELYDGHHVDVYECPNDDCRVDETTR